MTWETACVRKKATEHYLVQSFKSKMIGFWPRRDHLKNFLKAEAKTRAQGRVNGRAAVIARLHCQCIPGTPTRLGQIGMCFLHLVLLCTMLVCMITAGLAKELTPLLTALLLLSLALG